MESSAEIVLTSDQTNGFGYTATANLKQGKLNLPTFDLPIDVSGGKVSVHDGVIQYQDLIASTDGRDSLRASGSTTVDAFPLQTKLKTQFSNLDASTLRKLATEIPIEVTGKASGKASVSVDVEESLRTTLVIEGQGDSSTARYGSIVAKSTNLDVKITPLIFDSQQVFESLDGSVIVTAVAEQQTAKDVFQTLELDELERQLEVEAKASGEFRLELPLKTVQNIDSWTMQVAAATPTANISGQPVRDVRVKASLANGNLKFTDILAVPVPKSANGQNEQAKSQNEQSTSLVWATVDWPLTSTASTSGIGKLNFNGQSVPATWMIALIDRQIRNATGMESQFVNESPELLTGTTTFQSAIDVDANDPSNVLKWSGGGRIDRSTVIASGQQLNNLESNLRLSKGVLSFSQLRGVFDTGGSVDASGDFDLSAGAFKSADLRATSMPLKWVADIARESMPSADEFLKGIGMVRGQEDELAGNLAASLKLVPATNENPWAVSANITSKQLTIKGKPISNVSVSGDFDSESILVKEATAKVGRQGRFDLKGNWNVSNESGSGELSWVRLPIQWLASFSTENSGLLAGSTSGKVTVSTSDDPNPPVPYSVKGSVNAEGLKLAGVKSKTLGFDIRTVEDEIRFDRFRTTDDLKELDLVGKVKLKQPYAYSFDGTIRRLSLSKLFARPSVTEKVKTTSVSGSASGKFNLTGDLETMDLNSNGELLLSDLRFDNRRINDVSTRWKHLGNDWKNSSVVANAFGGTIKVAELTQLPQRIKIELDEIDAQQLTSLTGLPTKFSGKLSGDASLNDWALATTRWADLNLRGASLLIGPAEFGDLQATLEYRENKLEYSADGRLLNGKFAAEGSASLGEILLETELPLKIRFTNGSLSRLYRNIGGVGSLRSLQGSLAASADLVFRLDREPSGKGIVKINDLTWSNERLTREVSTNVNLANGVLKLDNLRADLKRGEISGRASIPIKTNSTGSYELNVRSFDLERFLEIVMPEPIDGVGLVDARISGRTGKTVTGRGTVSINRAKVLGLSGRTLRVPIQFQYQPLKNAARVEFRRSRFVIFKGNVTGGASIDFGRSVNLKTDLKISNLDTDALFSSLAGLDHSGQGRLSGHLKLNGNSLRSMRDLKGSFTGSLNRAAAFQLPLLETVARFLGGNQLQSQDFESKDIDLRLANGRVEVRRLNVSNSIAQVAVSGNAYLDGRLDLDVAARVERINQPTLLEQLLGSPLSQFRGSPVAMFAQAADFLSERLVFVQVDGTFRRPLVRPDPGKQLQEETIRYFLRGSQILPNADGLNN